MREKLLVGMCLLLLLEGCSSSQQNTTPQGPIPATPGMTGSPPPVGPGHPMSMGPNGAMQPNVTQPLSYAPNKTAPLNVVSNKPGTPLVGMNRPGGTPYSSMMPTPGISESSLAIDPILAQATMVGHIPGTKGEATTKGESTRGESSRGESTKGELILAGGAAVPKKLPEMHPDLMYAGNATLTGNAALVPPPPVMKELKEARELKEPGKEPAKDLVTGPGAAGAGVGQEPAPGGAPAMRMVGSKKFNLAFEVKDAPSGSTVEVYATQDQKVWKKVSATFQPPSLLAVEAPGEGTFGLMLLVKTSTGAARTPRAGETPHIWIAVDTTKPTIDLIGVDLSLTSKTPGLVVRWKAQDRNFGPRPVTIAYSETTDGPWIPLATNVTNSGRHEIPVAPTLPRKLLLRVDAADVAGNVGSAQTAQLVRIDLPWPPNSAQTAEVLPVSAPAPRPLPIPVEAPRPTPTISVVDIVPGN